MDQPEPTLVFRRALAYQMMTNTIGRDNLPRQVPVRVVNVVLAEHSHERKPEFAGIMKNGRWTRIKKKYGETQCNTCKNRCRHYCKCNIEKTMCRNCYEKHILLV